MPDGHAPDGCCNLRVLTLGCAEIDRMLTFRDGLRTHDEALRRYAQAKRALAAWTWAHVQSYADAKSGVVPEIMARARRSSLS